MVRISRICVKEILFFLHILLTFYIIYFKFDRISILAAEDILGIKYLNV
jgi:hypothetical protein